MKEDNYLVIRCESAKEFSKVKKYLHLVKKYTPKEPMDTVWLGKVVHVFIYNGQYYSLGERPLWAEQLVNAPQYFRKEILTKVHEQAQSK